MIANDFDFFIRRICKTFKMFNTLDRYVSVDIVNFESIFNTLYSVVRSALHF